MDETFIKSWLDQLPDEQIQREIDELQEQITALSAQINARREAIELKRRFSSVYGPQIEHEPVRVSSQDHGTATEHAFVTAHDDHRPPSIRESVLTVMADDVGKSEWAVNDLYEALVNRQWMELSNQALRSLSSALSRMTAEGQIVRARRGVYKLAARDAAPSLLDQGGESG